MFSPLCLSLAFQCLTFFPLHYVLVQWSHWRFCRISKTWQSVWASHSSCTVRSYLEMFLGAGTETANLSSPVIASPSSTGPSRVTHQIYPLPCNKSVFTLPNTLSFIIQSKYQHSPYSHAKKFKPLLFVLLCVWQNPQDGNWELYLTWCWRLYFCAWGVHTKP